MDIEITGPDFYIDLEALGASPLALDWPIYGGGDATCQCEYILSQYDIICDPETAKAMLRPYGAWEEGELSDHDENMLRLIWIIGCDLGENGEAYLSTY